MAITVFHRRHSVDRRQKQCRFILGLSINNQMSDCCPWLSRPSCCRRQPQHAYIFLYSPNMAGPSSSSSFHCCFVCILFGLCLAFVVILAAAVIYHLNSNILIRTTTIDPRTSPVSKKRQLPDFVNININPCENFYDFVCDNLTRKKNLERFNHEEELEQKWTHIRHKYHDKIMTNITNQSITNENNQRSSIYHLYQLCENQSPELLLDELERYFANLSRQEPYRSYLTLFNQNIMTNKIPFSLISLSPNPFFKIELSSSNSSIISRIHRRPLPSAISIFPNLTILNQTALTYLTKFDHDYLHLLSEEKILIKSYEQEYHQDSLILKRILSFSDYHQCLPSLETNTSTGLEKLIELLNHFLHSRLQNFNTKSIDKQIRILDKITDNHTLVEHLQRIKTDLNTIEQILLLNNSNNSCILDLLDQLLDKRIKSNELILLMNLDSSNQSLIEDFISNDWPFLMMLYDRLLKNISMNTLINFVFFDYYRQFIYPYYQPHIQHENEIRVHHSKEFDGYTYQTNYPNLSCRINSCFDIFNCYHPSLLNQLVDNHNQTFLNQIKTLVENLLNRFRLLTEQSDNLYPNEKKQILNELNQIQIHIGHYSLSHNISLSNQFSSYIEYVQLLSSWPYDQQERSYYTEPIYYPLNHTLFLPFGFLSLSNSSIEYHIIKLLLKILRLTIQSTPYNIECLLKSTDDEQDFLNTTKLLSNEEHIVYLLLRSKFLVDQDIVLDEYLWPFMSANLLMKRFLIDYTANNYCQNWNGYNFYQNNSYFLDDVHLIFHCQQASSIKQSKCTVT